MSRTRSHRTFQDAKSHQMTRELPETTCLIAQATVDNPSKLKPTDWREFCTLILGDDDRLYVRFVGKPNKAAFGTGVHAHQPGKMIEIEWAYPFCTTDYAAFTKTLNQPLKFGFKIVPREHNAPTTFISVNQREWLDWLPVSRSIAYEAGKCELNNITMLDGSRPWNTDHTKNISKFTFPVRVTTEKGSFVGTAKKLYQCATTFLDETLRILREVHLITNLRSPYIVQTFGVFGLVRTQIPLLITEFIPNGFTLETIINVQKTKFSPQDQLLIIGSIVRGMHYLHFESVPTASRTFGTLQISLEPDETVKQLVLWCGNLNPENILVTLDTNSRPNGAKIGGVRHLKLVQRPTFFACSGSTEFSAPEIDEVLPEDFLTTSTTSQFPELDKLVQKMDVFSFGVVLWCIVNCSNFPWTPVTTPATIRQCIKSGVRPVITPEIEASPFKEIMENCWKQDPESRPRFDRILREVELISGSV